MVQCIFKFKSGTMVPACPGAMHHDRTITSWVQIPS